MNYTFEEFIRFFIILSETTSKLVIFSLIIAKAFEAGIFSLIIKGNFFINFFRSFSLELLSKVRLKSPSVTRPLINLFLVITIIPNFFDSLI